MEKNVSLIETYNKILKENKKKEKNVDKANYDYYYENLKNIIQGEIFNVKKDSGIPIEDYKTILYNLHCIINLTNEFIDYMEYVVDLIK